MFKLIFGFVSITTINNLGIKTSFIMSSFVGTVLRISQNYYILFLVQGDLESNDYSFLATVIISVYVI